MKQPKTVLVIEDDELFAQSVYQTLNNADYRVEVASSVGEALKRFQAIEPDLVISDVYLPGKTGIDCTEELHARDPHLPIILMTGMSSTDTAIKAMQAGAYDFLLKPFQSDHLLDLVKKGLKVSAMRKVKVEVNPEVTRQGGQGLIGSSAGMQEVYKQIGILADKPITTLIRGETGTGKELVARAILHYSKLSRHTFLAVNCGAIPPTLLESELFGHEKGAFTGAACRRIGRFEQARNGTLFLDEIGDLQPETQIKLLRVLQEKVITRVGSNEAIPINTRVIAATHVDLEQAVKKEKFREDLYYRLSQAEIRIPPLRERREDIPELTTFFLKNHAAALGYEDLAISKSAIEFLLHQPWPGNVRELENVLRKASLFSIGQNITKEILQDCLYKQIESQEPHSVDLSQWIRLMVTNHIQQEDPGIHAHIINQVEELIVKEAMHQLAGNRVKVAKALGISRPTVYRILDRMHESKTH